MEGKTLGEERLAQIISGRVTRAQVESEIRLHRDYSQEQSGGNRKSEDCCLQPIVRNDGRCSLNLKYIF